jgi:riboflavin biosynthesis pyrimidine reductase
MLLRYLRSQSDAVLVGANTIRQEGYGTLRSDSPVGHAGTADVAPQPLLCVVSRVLALSPELPALQNPDLRVLLITTSDEEIPETPAQVEYMREPGEGPVSLRWALGVLREQRGVSRVVCEGGPTLNAHLFSEGCVDDFFLSVSPRVLGDEAALTLLSGSLSAPVGLSLRSHLVGDDFVFLRYEVP